MTRWIVIPIKALADCKTRLAPALDDRARRELVTRMFQQTFAAASETGDPVLLLGPSRHGMPTNIPLLGDPGQGLNAALAVAKKAAIAANVDRLVLLSADLPTIDSSDVRSLTQLEGAAVGIAPDLALVGTNALSLPLPQAADWRFGFGPASFAAHEQEAERCGLHSVRIFRRGLALDVDRVEDLTLLANNQLSAQAPF